MSTRSLPIEPTGGRRIRLGELQRMAEQVERLSGVQGEGVLQGSTGFIFTKPNEPWFWAKVTAKDSSTPKKYSWTLVIPDNEGDWLEPGGGPSGTDSSMPAYEANQKDIDVTSPVYVQMYYLTDSCFFFAPDDSVSTSSGSTITVQEQDGSPSYTSTSILEVNQTDGLTLTQPVAGTARINLEAATETQPGSVDTGAQRWAGDKTFVNSVIYAEDSSVVLSHAADLTRFGFSHTAGVYSRGLIETVGISGSDVYYQDMLQYPISGTFWIVNENTSGTAAPEWGLYITPLGFMFGSQYSNLNLPSGGGPAYMLEQGTDPSGIATGTAGIYCKDNSGTCKPYAFDDAGTVQVLTPHVFDGPSWLYDADDPFPHVNKEENIYLGVRRWTNESRRDRLLERMMAGEDLSKLSYFERTYVHVEYFKPEVTWEENQANLAARREQEIVKQQERKARAEKEHKKYRLARVIYEGWRKDYEEGVRKSPPGREPQEPKPFSEKPLQPHQPKPIPHWIASRLKGK